MTPDEIQKDREAGTLDDLKERVNAFSTLSLPGQMPMMHMGTSYLVNDLWKAVRTLTAENAALKKWADELKWALIEAQAALNGAPNTVGLHDQIEMALGKRHD